MSTARLSATSPWIRALTAHIAAVSVISLSVWFSIRGGWPIPPAAAMVGESVLATAAGAALKLPRWWLPVQLLFAPALYAALQLDLNPSWYLGAFAVTALLLGNSVRDRVPLFLSSLGAWKWLAEKPPINGTLIDLGCGTGHGIVTVSRLRPDVQCVGVESSPLLWLIARLRTAGRPNCRILFGSLWRVDLAPFDVVYVFLSPAPMERLWEKACRELTPGALLVSNSFEVPGATPDRAVRLRDRRRSRMLQWTMAGPLTSAKLAVGGNR